MSHGDRPDESETETMARRGSRTLRAGEALEEASGVSCRDPGPIVLQLDIDRLAAGKARQLRRRSNGSVAQRILKEVRHSLSQQTSVSTNLQSR